MNIFTRKCRNIALAMLTDLKACFYILRINRSKGLFLQLSHSKTGFTLLELLSVIAILGTVLLVVFPKIHFFEDYTLNAEARRVAGLLRYLEESASAKKIYYRVWFYPEKELFKIETSIDGIEFNKSQEPLLRGLSLKKSVEMEDVVISSLGRINEGEAAVVFNPIVGAEPFVIHLKMGQRLLTIGYNPYSGKVKVLKGYV
ncbi:MAG: type II secretion system protein [Deltaproteobacteria bacterium]|nr:type II secretion system protein [Deltaproteobacteria bacterium]